MAQPVIILRPEPGAERTAAKARDLGMDAIACPIFAIRPVDWSAPPADRFDALLVTSANAVRHAGERIGDYNGLPVYTVGEATAAAARKAGMQVEHIGRSDGEAALDTAIGDSVRAVLWLCGEHRTALEPGDADITAVAVYSARPLDPPAIFADAISRPAVIMVHSPRIGERLRKLVARRAALSIVAISAKAAQACGNGWSQIAIAPSPDDDAMLELARVLCQKPRGDDAIRTMS